MITERELFQKRNYDAGNGFYSRGLETSMGKLSFEVPRTRYFNFRPFIILHLIKEQRRVMIDFFSPLFRMDIFLLLSEPLFPLLV